MKKILFILMTILLLTACSNKNSKVEQPIEEHKQEQENVEEDEEIHLEENLDELQELYLNIKEDITQEELIVMLDESNLFYRISVPRVAMSAEKGKKITVHIGFLEEAVRKNVTKNDEDILKVSFREKTGQLLVTEYKQYETDLVLFHYLDGVYWDLIDQPEYEGYYIRGKEKGEIEITYNNGRKKTLDYLLVDSKEEQLFYLLNYNRD